MIQRRLSMRSVHEVLRLRHELGGILRDIGGAVGISPSTVSTSLRRAEAAGIGVRLRPESPFDFVGIHRVTAIVDV